MRLYPLFLWAALPLAAALTHGSGPFSTAAAAETLPRPDPPGQWRRATFDDQTTTSRCRGNTADVGCTLDTGIVCMFRGGGDGCDQAIADGGEGFQHDPATEWWKYRRSATMFVKRTSQASDRRGVVYDWKNGDIRLDVYIKRCFKEMCEEFPDTPTSFFLRRIGGCFKVIEWADLTMPR